MRMGYGKELMRSAGRYFRYRTHGETAAILIGLAVIIFLARMALRIVWPALTGIP